MTRKSVGYGQVTRQLLDTGESFRLQLPFGTFTIRARPVRSGAHWLVRKQYGGAVSIAYIGSSPGIAPGDVYRACVKVARNLGMIGNEDPEDGWLDAPAESDVD